MFYNRDVECADRETITRMQLESLRKTVARVAAVPFYRERLEQAGVTADGIKGLSDLERIPFTTKEDMRAHSPYGLLAVDMRDIVRIHASSGTTGTATVVGYTKGDLDNWATCIARIVAMAGGSDADIAQISFGYGLFTGAFGLHYGLEKLGASVIPMSTGNTKRQIQIMQEFGTTLLVSTPSYALYLGETAREMGIDPKKDLKVRLGVLGAEGHTEEMRKELERLFDMTVTENYGLSEVMGPGVSGECYLHTGMHINEDHFILEIIDPDTGQVLPEGAEGEVVITTITKEGQPLLRYRTRDISSITYAPCACGRTSARMAKVKGRSDDMLVIRGVNVFPSQIERAVLSVPGAGPGYEIIVSKEGHMDQLEVLVEVSDPGMLTVYGDLERISREVRLALREEILIDCKVSLVNPMSLKRFEGKAKRVTDLRD
ncbi:phenylacetate--CoA ligase [Eubacteriales bacterium OttesenSCG-928-M02]|nr:phenylacetate--CoA ligase [Eubacteriales bacterium OttesenSCG-928-M02]